MSGKQNAPRKLEKLNHKTNKKDNSTTNIDTNVDGERTQVPSNKTSLSQNYSTIKDNNDVEIKVSEELSTSSFLGKNKNIPLKKVFDEIKENYNSLPLEKLFNIMISRGLCPLEDPRLIEIRKELEKIYKGRHLTDIVLNFETFRNICEPVSAFIVSVLKNNLAIHSIDEWIKCLSIYHESIKVMTGKELGVSLVSANGQRMKWGQNKRTFPLNELLHIVIYCLATETIGFCNLHEHVGLEVRPSSEWIPENPLKGAGAIAVLAKLFKHNLSRMSPTQRHEFMRSIISDMAGGSNVEFDSKTFVSLERKGEYLKALVSWMINEGKLDIQCSDVDRVVQLYLECSSLQVDADALSILGATLANGGVCATTGNKILCCECIEKVVSIMSISSGKPGVPIMASSSGAVLIIVPGIFGLGIHSQDPRASGYFISALFQHFALNPYERIFLHMRNTRTQSQHSSVVSTLFSSARTGDILTLSSLIDMGLDLASRDYLGRTALHVATMNGRLSYVNILLKHCPFLVTKMDLLGNSALDEAQYFRYKDIEELLQTWEVVTKGTSSTSSHSHSSKSSKKSSSKTLNEDA